VITVENEDGSEGTIEVVQNDLVAEVKARILAHCFPLLQGRMVTLKYRGREMVDEKSVGDYGVRILNGSRFTVAVSANQPYSRVDYGKIARALIAEGHKKNAASFYRPGDEWGGKWTKGDEYKTYPVVDVDNIWSVVPPSKSTELAFSRSPGGSKTYDHGAPSISGLYCEIPERIRKKRVERAQNKTSSEREVEQMEREKQFRRARQQSMGSSSDDGFPTSLPAPSPSASRSFTSVYTCIVRGARYELVHKMEGKWIGEAVFMNKDWQTQVGGPHASSSRVGFSSSKGCWSEEQQITGESGISRSQKFYYIPQGDGVLCVETDATEFMKDVTILLKEEGPNVLILTATSLATGQPVLTETITFSNGFYNRLRTVQRFDQFGSFQGVYIFKEEKYIDEDTGAIEPLHSY